MTDPLLARWPRAEAPVARQTGVRDAATAAALEAYLAATTDVPTHRVIRL